MFGQTDESEPDASAGRPMLPCVVLSAFSDTGAGKITDAAITDAAHRRIGHPVIKAVVMVAMKHAGNAHGLGELIENGKAMRMTGRRLVKHKYVRRQVKQRFVGLKKNAGAVFEQSASGGIRIPPIEFPALIGGEVRKIGPQWRSCIHLWMPDFLFKNATQSGNPDAGNLNHAAMQISLSTRFIKQVARKCRLIRIVIAMNEPRLGAAAGSGHLGSDSGKGAFRFNVAQKNHGSRCLAGFLGSGQHVNHMGNIAMDITKKPD